MQRLLKFSEKQFSKNIKHEFFFMALKHIVPPLEFNEWNRIDLDLESSAFMCMGNLFTQIIFIHDLYLFYYSFYHPLPRDSQQFTMTHEKRESTKWAKRSYEHDRI